MSCVWWKRRGGESRRCQTDMTHVCLERADKIGLRRCHRHRQLLSSPPILLEARSPHPRRAAITSSLTFPTVGVKGQRRQGRVSMSKTCPKRSLSGSSSHFCRGGCTGGCSPQPSAFCRGIQIKLEPAHMKSGNAMEDWLNWPPLIKQDEGRDTRSCNSCGTQIWHKYMFNPSVCYRFP